MSTSERNSNFEVLRLLSILFVVMEHFITQSPLSQASQLGHGIINAILGSGARIAVNVFIILGSWFAIDARFKAERIVRMYLEVVFYSITITLLMIATGHAHSPRPILQGLLPFFGRSVWFASAYISLYAISPFLNRIFLLPRKQLALLVILLAILFPVVATIPCSTPIDYLSDFTWFCVVYILIGWIKRENLINTIRIKWPLLVIGFSIYLLLALASMNNTAAPVIRYWLDDIKSMPNFICALAMFSYFAKCTPRKNKLINKCAGAIFAVYIIHQVPAFQEFEWNTICRANDLVNQPALQYAVLIAVISSVLIAGYSFVDKIRTNLFEPRYMSLKAIRKLIKTIDKIYSI